MKGDKGLSEHKCGEQCRCPRHGVPVRYDYHEWLGHRCPQESEHGPITLYDADPTLRASRGAQQ